MLVFGAEVAKGKRQYREAAIFCEQSGAFASDCGQHLWQTALRRLAHRKGPPIFLEMWLKPRRCMNSGSRCWGRLRILSDVLAAFLFQRFEGGGGVDLTWCEGLGRTRSVVRVAGVEVWARVGASFE